MFFRNVHSLLTHPDANLGLILAVVWTRMSKSALSLIGYESVRVDAFSMALEYLAMGVVLYHGSYRGYRYMQDKYLAQSIEKYNKQSALLQDNFCKNYQISRESLKMLMMSILNDNLVEFNKHFDALNHKQRRGFLQLVFKTFHSCKQHTGRSHPLIFKNVIQYLKSLEKAYTEGATAGALSEHIPVEISAKIASFLFEKDGRQLAMTCQTAFKTAKKAFSNKYSIETEKHRSKGPK